MTSDLLERFDVDPHAHLSELALDLAVLGAPSTETKQHLASCSACTSMLAERAAAQGAFERSQAPLLAARALTVRLEAQGFRARLRRLWRLPLVGALVAAGLAGLVVFRGPSDGPLIDGIRTKGSVNASLYVQRGGAPAFKSPGQALREGDRLQLGYAGATSSTVTIFHLAGCNVTREYSGPIAREGVVPIAWTFKPGGGDRLAIAFAHQAISEGAFEAALKSHPRGCDPSHAVQLTTPEFSAEVLVLQEERS